MFKIENFDDVLIVAPFWITIILAVIITGVYFDPQIITQFSDELTYQVLKYLIDFAPYWAPIILLFTFYRCWKRYVHAYFLFNTPFVLLEIKVPQEVTKSPLAMETMLMGLAQTGSETTFIDRDWKGQLRAIYSLEIVSIEGQIKFFIYAMKKFRPLIEASLYAHYPGIEIYEAPDYTKSAHFNPHTMGLYGIDFKKATIDAYPIKTYVDYGIEKEQVEEENKIDPLNHTLEFLGSIGKGQQAWIQLILRAHKDEQRKAGTWFGTTDRWKDQAKAEIEKIRAEATPPDQKDRDIPAFPNPTKGQQEKIAALDRAVSKIPFDVGIRAIYFGTKETFDGNNITGLRTCLRAFSAPHLNVFKPTNWLNPFDYPWQDYKDIRQNIKRRQVMEAYKRRSFFYPPYIGKSFVMNVEEIASIFHLPGKVATTPTLTRIPSKKSEAPANLPI